MSKKKRLVVVVDMLNGFCKNGALASPQFMQTIVPNIKRLLDVERKKKNSKIIFLQDCHQVDDEEFKLFPPHCIGGTEETKIIKELAPFPNEQIYKKTRYSPFGQHCYHPRPVGPVGQVGSFKGCFCQVEFSIFLGNMGCFQESDCEVVIVGNCTDICVHYTAAGFRSRDYSVIIPADCVDTYDAPGHQAAQINEFFLKSHFPKILGIKVVDKVEEIL